MNGHQLLIKMSDQMAVPAGDNQKQQQQDPQQIAVSLIQQDQQFAIEVAENIIAMVDQLKSEQQRQASMPQEVAGDPTYMKAG